VKRLTLLFLLVCCFAGTSLWADTIAFNYSGSGFSGSGFFTATDQMNGSWLVTGVSGQQNTIPFSGVEALGTNPGYIYNNLVYVNSTPQLDLFGVLLSWNGGDVNLGYDAGFNGGSYVVWDPAESAIAFQATLVPEPSTLALMGGAFSHWPERCGESSCNSFLEALSSRPEL